MVGIGSGNPQDMEPGLEEHPSLPIFWLIETFLPVEKCLWMNPDGLSTEYAVFPDFHILEIQTTPPHIWGGVLFGRQNPFLEQLSHLSTGKGAYPQFFDTYPQFGV